MLFSINSCVIFHWRTLYSNLDHGCLYQWNLYMNCEVVLVFVFSSKLVLLTYSLFKTCVISSLGFLSLLDFF